MAEKRNRCSNCKWWDGDPTAKDGVGLCRRNAPASVSISGPGPRAFEAVWPRTLSIDWCGEFHVARDPVF